MMTVRKTANTTFTLIILTFGIIILTHWCDAQHAGFFYRMRLLIGTKVQIGSLHSLVVSFSFWMLLLSSAVDSVFREKSGLYIFDSFGIPIALFSYVAIWVAFARSANIDIRWFWLFYYIVLIICMKISFNGLSNTKGGGASKLKVFLKTPPKENDVDVHIFDRYVLWVVRSILLFLWFISFVALVIFCIQHRQIFGF